MIQLPNYLTELVKTGYLTQADFTAGVNKFLKAVPDLVNDYPKITQYLSRTLFTLKEQKALKYSDLVWIEEKKNANPDDDDMVFVEQYYHLMAYLLNEEYQKTGGNWPEVISMYTSNNLHKVFGVILKPLILEDGLFNEIADNIASINEGGKAVTDVIVALLQGDAVKVQASAGVKFTI